MNQDLKTRVEHHLRTAAPHVRDRHTYQLIWEMHRTMSTMVHAPIRMLLACPKCQRQHIDTPQPHREGCASLRPTHRESWPRETCDCGAWQNPPHRTHQCQHCGHLWRPADVPTEGVEALVTKGANDGAPLPEVVTIGDRQDDLRQWFEEWKERAEGVNYLPSARNFLEYCVTRLCARTL